MREKPIMRKFIISLKMLNEASYRNTLNPLYQNSSHSGWLLWKTLDQRVSELIFKQTVYRLNPVESKCHRKTQSGHISVVHKLQPLFPTNALNSIPASHAIQASHLQRAFNRLHYLKSHPDAQKQFGGIAAVKYSFQYSVVGTNGFVFHHGSFPPSASVLLSDVAPTAPTPFQSAS